MATYYSVPTVLTKAKETYALWFKILTDFPKVHRYNLGGKIEEYFLGLLENIFTAIYLSGEKKYFELSSAIVKLDGVKFFFQLAWENKCFSNERYAELSEKLNEVGRILGGWKKGLEKKTPPPITKEKQP
ncbi:MAG: four helix bundle protein [Patescibacteria group bacterium]|nr:four helix bundle protein [Patescibacteria group bacterium]